MQATPWLRRAIAVSIVLHGVVGVTGRWALPPREPEVDVVDVELAPEAPPVEALPEEKERAEAAAAAAEKEREQAAADERAREKELAAGTLPSKPEENEGVPVPVDAAIDAPGRADAGRADAVADGARDAAVDAVADAARDAAVDAGAVDAGSDAAVDAMTVAGGDAGMGSGDVVAGGSGSAEGSGSAAGAGAVAVGSGAGSGTGEVAMGSSGSDVETEPAVEGAATSAGTAANLVQYFPAGHVITALVRFDRLRGTEWAAPAENILKPLPDYKALFGTAHKALLADKLDMVVISSPKPRDVTATTLVAKTALARPALRDLLGGAFTWSTTRAGMLGRRSNGLPGDKRVVLSPFRGWFVLGQPADLPALAPTPGDVDRIEASEALPTWLGGIRAIEAESGSDAQGPALVATFAFNAARYKLPEVGLGVSSAPGPVRVSVAMELVHQGWWVRGNIKMASEADAIELAASIVAVQRRIANSTLLRMVLQRGKALNAVTNLQLARAGDRLSYATSISIADARILLAFAAQALADYFKPPTASP